jgi:photosystem II stability/assembly factor-like uncharacterized protein
MIARPVASRLHRSTMVLALGAVFFVLPLAGCGSRATPERWQAVRVPTDADFTGIWFSDSLHGWITGSGWAIEGGIVGRTHDGGRTWRFESGILSGGGKGSALGRVQFRDSLHGCVTTAYGAVLVTVDGAENWRPARIPGLDGGSLYDVQFIDASNGWAGGSRIVRTEDGGETWRTLVRSQSENGYLTANAIHFVDTSRGWLVSHGGTLMRTENGGLDWTPVALPFRTGERPTLWDVTFVDADHGWIAGERGNILHTSDGGATWTLQQNGVPIVRDIPKGEQRRHEVVPELETEPDRLALMAIQFADSARGWAVGYYADVAESVILHTENGGAAWESEQVVHGELLRSLFVLDSDHAWAAGDRARMAPQVVLRYSAAR